MLADYQYILNVPDPIDEDDEYTLMGIVQKLLTPSLKTNTEGVETFAVTSLKNIPKNREGESISVYGIQKDSKYVSAELFEDGVTISDGYAEKYGMKVGDDDDKIRLNQRKPSKYKGLRRFGPEKNLQRINKFMKERPIFYKNLIQMKENIRFYLRCFYCITKVMILQFNSENRTELARNG